MFEFFVLIACITFSFILGYYAYAITHDKIKIGQLIINKNDPTKTFFELHIDQDPNDIDSDQTVQLDIKIR